MKDVILKVSVPDDAGEIFYFEIWTKCTTKAKNRNYHIQECTEIQPDDAIRAEMDSDMEESGMAQGEIESCLTHWNNKYLIIRKP